MANLTPDTKGEASRFTKHILNGGQLYLNFTSDYDFEKRHIQDIQLSEKPLAIIGILHCGECPNLSEGVAYFEKIIQEFPSMMAYRCLAFEPREDHSDDVGGLVMIPNVGDLTFYLSTVLSDLCCLLLTEFEGLAQQIEKVEALTIESPSSIPHSASSDKSADGDLEQLGAISNSWDLESRNSPSKSTSSQKMASLTLGKLIGTFTEGKVRKKAISRSKKMLSDLYLLSGCMEEALARYMSVADVFKMNDDFIWQAAAMEGLYCVLIVYEIRSLCNPEMQTETGIYKLLTTELPERYNELVSLYEKGNAHTLAVRASKRLTTLMAKLYFFSKKEGPSCPAFGKISKQDLSQMIGRIWKRATESIEEGERLKLACQLSNICQLLGMQRKQAFYLREGMSMLFPGLYSASKSTLDAISGKDGGIGILQLGLRICELYGITDSATSKLQTIKKRDRTQFSSGWPSVQIEVAMDCIRISEILQEYSYVVIFTTKLVQHLHGSLSKDDQLTLSTKLQKISLVGNFSEIKENGQEKLNEEKEISPSNMKGVWGVNVLESIKLIRQEYRKLPIKNEYKDIDGATNKDTGPFLYDPYSAKGGNQDEVILVEKEVATFELTFFNPFAFDLDIQNLSLVTEGVTFNSLHYGFTIPACTTLYSIKIEGIPMDEGTLEIKGCHGRLFGCLEQFFPLLDRGKEFDKGDVESTRKKAMSSSGKTKSLTTLVIRELPLLQVRKSTIHNGSIMLFDGERATIKLEIENIGRTPINYLNLKFKEEIGSIAKKTSELNPAEKYEMEYYDSVNHVFTWVNAHPERKGSSENVLNEMDCFRTHIPPHGRKELIVEMFGKRGCSGGSIILDYGLLNNNKKDISSHIYYTRQVHVPILISVHCGLELQNMDIMLYLQLEDMDIQEESNPGDRFGVCGNTSNSTSRRGSIGVAAGLLGTSEPSSPGMLIGLLNKRSKNIKRTDINTQNEDITSNESLVDANTITRDYCLLSADIVNVWSAPFEITFEVNDNPDEPKLSTRIVKSVTVFPGSLQRILIPIRRFLLSDKVTSQPVPDVGTKQFIVSNTIMTRQESEEMLTTFWYKQELLKRMRAQFKSRDRIGDLDLSGMLKLSYAMVDTLRPESIQFRVQGQISEFQDTYTSQPILPNVQNGGEKNQTSPTDDESVEWKSATSSPVRSPEESDTANLVVDTHVSKKEEVINPSKGVETDTFAYRCNVGDFLHLHFDITQRGASSIQLMLRFLPVQDGFEGSIPLTKSFGKLAWHGPLNIILPKIEEQEHFTYCFSLFFQRQGHYRILYHCEELEPNRIEEEMEIDSHSSKKAPAKRKIYWGPEPIQIHVV